MRAAVSVIEMIEEFVNGSFSNERSRIIVPELSRLVMRVHNARVPLFFIADCHRPWDKKLDIMGEHTIYGTKGARPIKEFESKGEKLIGKRSYSAFFNSYLERELNVLGLDTVILTGVLTDIYIHHTAADAFYRGFDAIVPTDRVASLDDDTQKRALEEMVSLYGATLILSRELVF